MKKVLLINDCRLESMIMRDIINGLGYSVKIGDEYDAADLVSNYKPDIVIVNLVMENIKGDMLIEKIKDYDSEIKCILSSCSTIELRDYTDTGVDGVLQTPVDKKKIEEAINCVNSFNNEIRKTKQSNDSRSYAYCPYCGNKLNNTFIYCPSCGKKL